MLVSLVKLLNFAGLLASNKGQNNFVLKYD